MPIDRYDSVTYMQRNILNGIDRHTQTHTKNWKALNIQTINFRWSHRVDRSVYPCVLVFWHWFIVVAFSMPRYAFMLLLFFAFDSIGLRCFFFLLLLLALCDCCLLTLFSLLCFRIFLLGWLSHSLLFFPSYIIDCCGALVFEIFVLNFKKKTKKLTIVKKCGKIKVNKQILANRNADQQQCIVKIILFVIWKKQRNRKRKELENERRIQI